MGAVQAFSDAAQLRAAFSDAGHDAPIVVIDFRPPCATARAEIAGGVEGPNPEDVVKSLCRALGVGPGAVSAVGDPSAAHLRNDNARCYVLNAAEQRVARVSGLSFAWINVAASALANRGWRPGLNREPGLRPEAYA